MTQLNYSPFKIDLSSGLSYGIIFAGTGLSGLFWFPVIYFLLSMPLSCFHCCERSVPGVSLASKGVRVSLNMYPPPTDSFYSLITPRSQDAPWGHTCHSQRLLEWSIKPQEPSRAFECWKIHVWVKLMMMEDSERTGGQGRFDVWSVSATVKWKRNGWGSTRGGGGERMGGKRIVLWCV